MWTGKFKSAINNEVIEFTSYEPAILFFLTAGQQGLLCRPTRPGYHMRSLFPKTKHVRTNSAQSITLSFYTHSANNTYNPILQWKTRTLRIAVYIVIQSFTSWRRCTFWRTRWIFRSWSKAVWSRNEDEPSWRLLPCAGNLPRVWAAYVLGRQQRGTSLQMFQLQRSSALTVYRK